MQIALLVFALFTARADDITPGIVGTEAEARAFQAEVGACNTAGCYNRAMAPHVGRALRGLEGGYRALGHTIRKEVLAACRGKKQPASTACVVGVLDNLVSTARELSERECTGSEGPATLDGWLALPEYNTTNFAKLVRGMCGTEAGDNSCLRRTMDKVTDEAGAAAAHLNSALRHLKALSVQSMLCESGETAVFDEPEAASTSTGFGRSACGTERLVAPLAAFKPMDMAYAPPGGTKPAKLGCRVFREVLVKPKRHAAVLESIRLDERIQKLLDEKNLIWLRKEYAGEMIFKRMVPLTTHAR